MSARCFFGQIRLARSHCACVALAGFGNGDWSRSVFRDRHGCFGSIRLKVPRCASERSRFGFRRVRHGLTCIGVHRHLTIRSSRPHVVASATCFTLRLHASAAPPRGGLTQALGGRKAFCNCVAREPDLLASIGVALRTSSRLVASSVKFLWRAHTLHALRCPASETLIAIVSSSGTDTVASVRSG